VALIGLGWALGAWTSSAFPRLLLVFVGLFTAARGLVARFRQDRWALAERIETAAMLATTGMGCVLGWLALDKNWESGRMLFGALFLVALVGVVLVLLPTLLRKVALSLLIVFHFGGMATAITSVDPPGSTGPWISKQLWTWVYSPYLSFLYLTNAYHFYSPDPGPPSLFWFAVCYDDGSYTWVKLPERANSYNGMHYQRLLALPEHTFTAMPRLPFTAAECAEYNIKPPRGTWEEICLRRQMGSTYLYTLTSQEKGKTIERHLPIPTVIGMADSLQFREPQENHKRMVATVAKRIFWTAPPAPRPGVKVKSVKMYRVVNQLLAPPELLKGGKPLEKTRHWGYFIGEFNGDGRIVDSLEPFLYWFLPITYVPQDYADFVPAGPFSGPAIRLNSQPSKDSLLLDCLEMHAAGRAKPKEKKP
jgi:hypothetical protein